MKTLISLLFLSAMATLSLSAKKDEVPRPAITSKMESAGEKYVRALLKAFPNKGKDLRSSQAREKLYKELASAKLLTVDGNTQLLLKRRKEVVSDIQMQTMVKNLAADESEETKFLLKLAANERLKGEPKLLVFRLLGQAHVALKKKNKEAAAAIAEAKKKAITDLFEHYKSKAEELGRMPADLAELALPESLAKVDGKEWIYFGTKLNLKSNRGRLLFLNPNPSEEGTTIAITDTGKSVTADYKMMMSHWDKVKDKQAPQVVPKKEDKPAVVANGDYSAKVAKKFTAAFTKVVEFKNKNAIWPMSLEDAGVTGELMTLDSVDGSEKKAWVYIVDKGKVPVSKTQFIIMISPYSINNVHLAALSDGKVVNLPADQFKKVMTMIKAK